MRQEKQNPEALILARESRGYTQTQLAKVTKIDQGTISKYEAGIKPIPDSDLERFAQALDVSVSFFYRSGERHGPQSAEIFHRKRKSLKTRDLVRITAELNRYRLDTETLLNAADIELEDLHTIPRYLARDYKGDIEHIAALVRAAWEIPPGQIQNLTQKLESAGVFIFPVDFETALIDETAQWRDPTPPVMLVNTNAPTDRLRFSLAHALGHLIMHYHSEPYDEMENEADQFAAAFLMPADDIVNDLKPATIEHFLQLKPAWKVSMQALIHRALELGIINQTRYTSLFQMLSRAGYRKSEPYALNPEQPKLMKRIFSFYEEELHWSTSDIAELLGISESMVKERFYPRRLHLVPRKLEDSSNGQLSIG